MLGSLGFQQVVSGPVSSDPSLPSMKACVLPFDATLTRNRSGTGDSLAFSGNLVTLTDAAATFTSDDIPQLITTAGWPSAANNGNFIASSNPSSTQIRWGNAAGVSESSGSATWALQGRILAVVDRAANRTYTAPLSTQRIPIDTTTLPGKKLGRTFAANIQQSAQNVDATYWGWNNANVPFTMLVYGSRSGGVGTEVCAVRNNSGNYNRAAWNSPTTARLERGGLIADITVPNDTSEKVWAWTYDPSASANGRFEFFGNGVSLGTANFSSIGSITDANRFLIGTPSASGVTMGLTFKAIGIADYVMTPAQQLQVKDYVDLVYA